MAHNAGAHATTREESEEACSSGRSHVWTTGTGSTKPGRCSSPVCKRSCACCSRRAHRDRLAGLNTAGFVSGYRGSPLGGFDRELWRAAPYLDAAQIRFQPGLNEDLAATSIWGAQQANLFAGARYDGVFGMWYGKGPGVDRSGDPFKHGNAAGTSRLWRRDRRRRRRPHLQVVVAAASERVRVHRCVDTGAESRPTSRRSSSSVSTAMRCRASAAAGSVSRSRRRRPTRRRASRCCRKR